MIDRHGLAGQQGVNGVAGVLGLDQRFALAVIDAAFVAKLSLLVENEDMRRGFRAIRARNSLRIAVV